MKTLKFGPWWLCKDTACLVHQNTYYIPLRRVTHCAGMLDFIFQVQAKSWADPETMKGLIDGLQYCLRPQATMCGCGQDLGDEKAKKSLRYLVRS